MKRKFTHTFAVCAYGVSPYLENCVRTLTEQKIKSRIIICTSTPGENITRVAEKYNVSVYVRKGKSDIRDDWNFAYDCAETDFVTIAHQDDEYCPEYTKALFSKLQKIKEPEKVSMFFTDYRPIDADGRPVKDKNSRIRRLIRTPLKSERLAGEKGVKKMVLSLGNTICCPAVTYNKLFLGKSIFRSEFKFNIDWDTFLMLAGKDGVFAYTDLPLMHYRIHKDATSREFIDNRGRYREDLKMFEKFWPKPVAGLIMKFYVKAYDVYKD